ncbi:hypothetical protein HZC21_01400 [Candidatus Peregrinibacteria bacterium]|nr:hypothetical protein [Candidatus Peregrinibacteria bacterium]
MTWGIAILTLVILLIFSYFILRKKQWTSRILLIITIVMGYYYLPNIAKTLQLWLGMEGWLLIMQYRGREIFITTLTIVVFVYFSKVLIEQRALSLTKVDPAKINSNAVKHFGSFPFGLQAMILWFVFSPLLLFWFLSDFYTAYQTLYWISVSVGTIFSWLTAYFLYKRKNWMRILLIVLSCIGIVLTGIQLATFIMLVLSWRYFDLSLLSSITLALLINSLFVWYLSRKRTKAFFVSA